MTKPVFEAQLKSCIGNLLYCIEHGQGDTLEWPETNVITLLVKRGLVGIKKEDLPPEFLENLDKYYASDADLVTYEQVEGVTI